MDPPEILERRRLVALHSFNRNVSCFNKLIARNSPAVLVHPQHQKVVTAWRHLEEVHEALMEVPNVDVHADEDGYNFLDQPAETFDALMESYSRFLSKKRPDTGRLGKGIHFH